MASARIDSTKVSYDNCWPLPETASALALDSCYDERLWMVTDKSFGYLNLDSGFYHRRIKLPLSYLFRANDGATDPNGDFWFGSMAWRPLGLDGSLYQITAAGELIDHLVSLGIPNTLCWSADGTKLYLIDAWQQRLFCFQRGRNQLWSSVELLLDLSKAPATPDGGALDSDGNLWNCHWGGQQLISTTPKVSCCKRLMYRYRGQPAAALGGMTWILCLLRPPAKDYPARSCSNILFPARYYSVNRG